MLRLSLAVVLTFSALPAVAQSDKEVSCGYQAQVVAAVQQARLDRVEERSVQKTILESDPEWPANFNNAIPLITPWVYEMPMKDVRENDLSDVWSELCLQQ